MTLPANGSRIVFDKVPAGSYASTGVVYLVKHYGSRRITVDLQNEATGASTQDSAFMYRHASFRTL